MNWDRVEGQWKQLRGKAENGLGKFMNDELAAIAGKHEQLVGTLQEQYGIAKEEAKRHVDEFKKIVEQLKQSNGELMRFQKSSGKKKEGSNGISVRAKTSSGRRKAE